MSRRLLVITAVLAGLLCSSASTAAAFSVGGLSDQNAVSLLDPRLGPELSMTAARLVVRWDVATADPGPTDAWINAAKLRNLTPLIVFNRTPDSRCPAAPCVLPTVAEYTAAFNAFRRRWPSVTEFGPWNEANVLSQPPARTPQRAAEYYNAMVANCPTCTVLGAELLDSTDAPNYVRGMQPFLATAPKAWGIHNYEDVNHLRTTGTDALLAVTTGEIWLTEGAGLVRYFDGQRVTFPYDEARAADATSFMFDYVDSHPDRVQRLYYYALQNRGPNDDGFDTALLRRDGSKRPAWDVVAARLGRLVPHPVATTPAVTVPAPIALLKRSLRVTKRGLFVGPLHCAKASTPRCRGRIEVRWNGKSKAFGKRTINIRAGHNKGYTIRVGPGNRRRLRRKSSNHKVTFVISLTKPRAYVKSYPRMKIVRKSTARKR